MSKTKQKNKTELDTDQHRVTTKQTKEEHAAMRQQQSAITRSSIETKRN